MRCSRSSFALAVALIDVAVIDASAAADDPKSLGGGPPPLTINEIRIAQDGPDTDEYLEIAGPPGTPLTDIQYIVLGDALGGDDTGVLEVVVDLTGHAIPPSGLFLIAEDTFTLGPAPDLVTALDFENFDTVTHMLVGGLSAMVADDLDVDGDGTLDSTPWTAVFDVVVLVEPTSPDASYGPGSACVMSPTCQEISDGVTVPSQVFRCPDGDGAWLIGNPDPSTIPPTDSPGGPSLCPGCGNGYVDPGEPEECDGDDMGMGGESSTCDADCTLVACGDGTTNASAGEECDDVGESATCDVDCTLAVCGDGRLNPSAGEQCDGDGMGKGGPTSTCDDDCTPAACGDGNANAAAGEQCDGDGRGQGGQTPTCDDDCTLAICGDQQVNPAAGETCDEGGRSDRCDDDCTAVTCGDGILNTAAGEQCDGDGMGAGGPTPTCDDDCTLAICGDGVVNPAAGETCDSMGQTAACDADCTAAECGDGILNPAAGEQCEDGNTQNMDGCAADCTIEVTQPDPGSTADSGADESGSSGGQIPPDEGCNCSSRDPGRRDRDPGRGPTWSLLALLGLVAARRRRP